METFWLTVKIILALLLLTGVATALIAVFHPLRFNIRLRASLKGQRAEVLFCYLFRLLELKAIATPASQNVYISVLGLKKLVYSEGRIKKDQGKQTQTQINGKKPAPEAEKTQATKTHKEIQAKAETEAEAKTETEAEAAAKTAAAAEAKAEAEAEAAAEAEAKAEAESPESTQTAAQAEAEAKAAAETKAETEAEAKAKSAAKTEAKAKAGQQGSIEDKLRIKLRRLKKKGAEVYKEVRHCARLFISELKILKPVLARFYGRAKKGVAVPKADITLKYAFSEAYLTGMCQGNMVIFKQLLTPLGVNFMPIPVFNCAPCLHTRGGVTAVVYPWRFVGAFVGLLFEKRLYTEGYGLYKWYKKKKNKN